MRSVHRVIASSSFTPRPQPAAAAAYSWRTWQSAGAADTAMRVEGTGTWGVGPQNVRRRAQGEPALSSAYSRARSCSRVARACGEVRACCLARDAPPASSRAAVLSTAERAAPERRPRGVRASAGPAAALFAVAPQRCAPQRGQRIRRSTFFFNALTSLTRRVRAAALCVGAHGAMLHAREALCR